MNTKNYVRVEYIAATGRYEASIPTKTGTLTLGNHFLDALSAALAHDIGFIREHGPNFPAQMNFPIYCELLADDSSEVAA